MSKATNKLSFAQRLVRQSSSIEKKPLQRTDTSQASRIHQPKHPKNHYVEFKQTHSELKNMLSMLECGKSRELALSPRMYDLNGLDQTVQPQSTAKRRLVGKAKTQLAPQNNVKKQVMKESIWDDSIKVPKQPKQTKQMIVKPKKEGIKMWSSLMIPKNTENKYQKQDPESVHKSTILSSKSNNIGKKDDKLNSQVAFRHFKGSKSLKNYRKQEKSESVSEIKIDSSVRQVPTKKGIPNSGNTCYINALVQCLFHLPQFNDYIVSQRYNSEARGKDKGVIQLYRQLYLNVTRNLPDKDLSTLPLKRSVSKLCQLFMTWQQQDPHEFMKQLLISIHDQMNRIAQQPKYKQFQPLEGRSLTHLASAYWKQSKLRDDSYIYDSFCGQIYSNIKCSNCCYESQTFENFLDLSLPMQNKTENLEDLLAQFFEPQKLSDFYFCNKCNKSSKKSTKSLNLWKAPKFLIIQLKRSQLTKKNTDPVSIPQRLSLKSLMTISDDRSARFSQYNLSGILMHQGMRDRGHNWSVVKEKGQWYELDDQKVKVIEASDMTRELKGSRNAYLLFYASLYG